MATQQWGDIVFSGALDVTLSLPQYPDYPDGFLIDRAPLAAIIRRFRKALAGRAVLSEVPA